MTTRFSARLWRQCTQRLQIRTFAPSALPLLALVGVGGTAAGAWCQTRPAEDEVDVVIVGGGIVGASLALSLLRREPGCSIVLVDRATCGSEASGLSAGTISCLGAGDGSNPVADLCYRTLTFLKSLRTSSFDFQQGGALLVATTPGQQAHIKKQMEDSIAHGYTEQQWMEHADLRKFEPALSGAVSAAVFTPLSCHVDPPALTHTIVEEATRKGCMVMENTPVVSMERVAGEDRAYNVVLGSGGRVLRCRNLVLATGAWPQAAASLKLKIPVSPVKGQMWVTEELLQGEGLQNNRVLYLAEAAEYFAKKTSRDDVTGVPAKVTHTKGGTRLTRHGYGKQMSDGRFAFGGDRVPCEGDDYTVDESGIAASVAHAAELLPAVKDKNLLGSWTGIMGFSKDGRPLVGHLEPLGLAGVWVAMGFGAHGVMEGPGAAEVLAEWMCTGETPESTLMAYFDPCRKDGCSKC